MKIGDLVTYKQRADLQQFPCPWGRMGIILRIGPGRLKVSTNGIGPLAAP